MIRPREIRLPFLVLAAFLVGCAGSSWPPSELDAGEREAALARAAEAGIGLPAGSDVSGYMGRLAATLQVELAETGTLIARRGDEIFVGLPFHLAFMEGDELNPFFRGTIEVLAGLLSEMDQTLIELIGRTPDEAERTLAAERAARIAVLLVDELGMRSERVWLRELAEVKPLPGGASVAVRLVARRVELRIQVPRR